MEAQGRSDWRERWHALWEQFGGKWSFHILRLLAEEECGFNEMQRSLPGITPKMLSKRLKELECRGFVDRSVLPTTPPSTNYRLTERGTVFVSILTDLEDLVDVVACCDGPDACAVLGAHSNCSPVG